MATSNPCKKNDANGWTHYFSLTPLSPDGALKANPTLAAGDFKIAIDDGAPANLATLPAVDADFTKRVKLVLSQAETNGDRITIIGSDQTAPKEWCDWMLTLHTVTKQFDDLSTQTSVDTVDNFIDTEIADIQTKLGTPAGASISADIAAIEAQTDDIGAAGAGLSAIPWNAAWDAEVQSEVADAFAVYDPPTQAELVSEINSVQFLQYVFYGTAQAGAAGSITLDAGASSTNDLYKGLLVWLSSQTGEGQVRLITAYDGTTKVATITPNWVTNPGATTEFALLFNSAAVYDRIGAPAGASVSADIATVDTVVDAIKAKTDNLPSDPADASVIAGRFDTLDTAVADLPTNVELATSQAAADDATLAAIAALNNLSASQVNAEVVDALATDTYAEPTGVPAATISLSAKLNWLYMALRNKVTVTGSKKTFFDDGDAAEWEKDLSDDGTTYTETEANAI